MRTHQGKVTHRVRHSLLLAAIAAALAQAAAAQDHDHMDHEGMAMPADPGHESMPGMPESDAMDHSNMSGMTGATTDHGDMDMSGDAAPAGARDPNAYAEGYTLDSGPYALSGSHQLHLADEHRFGSLLVDRLERVRLRDGNLTAYDLQGRYGGTYDAAVLKAEGEAANGKTQEARTELLWSHAVHPYWDAQLGVRHDSGIGPERTWAAVGVQGLAPYWFDVDAAFYIGESGRTALRLAGEYELLLTQRLVLQPRAELNAYGKQDSARDIGSGISEAVAGLRLRYEITRQFAPYAGVEWTAKLGNARDLARAAGEPLRETRWVAGVRAWF